MMFWRFVLFPQSTLPLAGVRNIGSPAVANQGGAPDIPLVLRSGGRKGWAPTAAITNSAFLKEVEETTISENIKSIVKIWSGPLGADGERKNSWEAVIVDNTLFIRVPEQAAEWEADGFGFREAVLAVMELSEGVLNCESMVLVLQKDRNDIAFLLRSFMLCGFELVHPKVYQFNSNLLLVGCSL